MQLHLHDTSLNKDKKHGTKTARLAAILFTTLAYSTSATAADTVETWDIGATDVDFYVGHEGIGAKNRTNEVVFGDIMLGYGLLDRFSAYFGTTLSADGYATNAQASPYLGIFGTPIDSAHFDLDVFLDVSKDGDNLRIGPSVELNLDAKPDMSTVGLYNRTGIPFGGLRGASTDIHAQHPAMSYYVESTTGAYARVAHDHQLLLEFNVSWHPDPAEHERPFDIGALALGYNITLSDRIELIEELSVDIPQDNERMLLSAMSGFIVTLPSTSH